MKLMQQQMAMGAVRRLRETVDLRSESQCRCRLPMLDGAGMDTGKAYVAERENLELLEHEWVMDHFERRAIKMLKRMERSGL
eukprot:scaffold207_cov409-Prasinococcus_capsulatus_cf.AAC.142